MAYTTIDDPTVYFQMKTYTGNGTAIGSGGNSITFDGDTDLAPGMLWIKRTDSTSQHDMYDVVRGAQIRFYPDNSDQEDTGVTESVNAFTSDGFNLGNSGGGNASGGTYVAYCWKASGSGSSNTSGSINTTSTSAETTSKFSISTYTGTGSAATIGHGLGVVPHFVLCKERGGSGDWVYYHHKNTSAPETDVLEFNNTTATADNNGMWNDTAPTSTLITLGGSAVLNNSSDTYVAYAWSGVQGFSKFGTYEGNGNADGTFVYTGFKPKFLIAKSIDSTAGAYMIPAKTDWHNGDTHWIYGYSNTTKSNGAFVDFHSNGFKLRKNDDINNSETYVYMAWAEAPFVNSEGEPGTAR